jgi:hypothetical protein
VLPTDRNPISRQHPASITTKMADIDAKAKDFSLGEPIQPVSSTTQGEMLKSVDDGALDEAAMYLANTDNFGPMTPEKEKAIVKKIDSWMIPLVSLPAAIVKRGSDTDAYDIPQLLFAATLAAVDKVQISTASLYGFQTDNHMVGQQYQWIGSILALGVRTDRPCIADGVHRQADNIIDLDWIDSSHLPGPTCATSQVALHCFDLVVCSNYTLRCLSLLGRIHGFAFFYGLSRSRHNAVHDHDCGNIL